jgi:DNA-binding response OmpR family regulator
MHIPRVLLVGAEPFQRQELARELEGDEAFQVAQANGDLQAVAQTQSERFDAIIIDAHPHQSSVRDLCIRLRCRGLRVPILVLGASSDEDEIIDALDAGAIDYLIKPISTRELGARLRAHLREHEDSEHAVLTIGPYNFRPAMRSLDDPISKRHIKLTLKEATVLKCLYRAAGQAVSREALLDQVWSYSTQVRTHTVETHIYRLRQKIEPNPERPSLILNGGAGYSLGC